MTHLEHLIQRYPALSVCREAIEQAVEQIIRSYQNGGKLLVCGNGGSCADASHIVGELMKSFCLPRELTDAQKATLGASAEAGADLAGVLQQGLPAIDLAAHTALNTAFANDADASACYAQQAFVYAGEQDVLLGISTSGNADNVIKAGIAAKAKGAVLIGLTGQKPCRMDELFDVVIHAPAQQTYQIQEYHLPIYHTICLCVEAAFFADETCAPALD